MARCCMAFIRHSLCAALLALGICSVADSGQAAVERGCYADWSEAGPVARREALLPVAQILKSVRAERAGRVARVQLCQGRDSFHYRVAVFDVGGSLSWLKVDARTGQIETLVRP